MDDATRALNGINNGEGMTGFDPQTAKNTIDSLYNIAVEQGLERIEKSISDFFFYLNSFWYSPKAVEFYDYYAENIRQLMERANKTIINICNAATNAYNIHASVNGLPTITFDRQPKIYLEDGGYKKLEEKSSDGLVGMNRYYVKQVISDFKVGLASGISILATVPMKIDLFDPESIQRSEFNKTIRDMSESIMSELTSMANDVGRQIETEENAISRASDQAISLLRGY